MNEVTIKSTDSGAKLVFSGIEGDYFVATYDSPEVRVSKRVWGYSDCELFVDLFESMAAEWRGWEGEKIWSSIEGEFSVSGASDKKGHIRLKLGFTKFEGSEPWKLESILNLEAGLIDGIAKKLRSFFLG